MKRAVALLLLGWLLFLHFNSGLLWSDEPKPAEPAKPEAKPEPPEPKPDPSGGNTGDIGVVISDDDKPKLKETDEKNPDPAALDANNKALHGFITKAGDAAGKNRVAINMMWTLLTGFLVMFMQAGFAMVETGLTRAKNVAHTMAMNFMVYAIGMLGFWMCGFAFMFGGYNSSGAMRLPRRRRQPADRRVHAHARSARTSACSASRASSWPAGPSTRAS